MKYKCGTHMYEYKKTYKELNIVRTMKSDSATKMKKLEALVEFLCSSEALIEYLYVVLDIYEKEEQGDFYATAFFYEGVVPFMKFFRIVMIFFFGVLVMMPICMLSGGSDRDSW